MGPQELMGNAVRLGAAVDALAALAAHVRIETEGLPADPRVRELLAAVATEVLGEDGEVEGSSAGGRGPAGLARPPVRRAWGLGPGR